MAIHQAQQLRNELLFSFRDSDPDFCWREWVSSACIQPVSEPYSAYQVNHSTSNLKSGRSHFAKNIQFHDQVSLHIGSENELTMQSLSIPHRALLDWHDKPWQLWQKNSFGQWVRRAPLSETAVSSSVPNCTSCAQLHRSNSSWPIVALRITDNHGQVEGFEDAQTRGNDEAAPDQLNPQPPPAVPDFMRHLLDLAPVEAELVPGDDFVFYVRTWFLDHDVHPRCEHPRVVELNSEWPRWHHEIVSSWRDFLTIDQGHFIHVVTPEPPRHARYRRAVADLIITTGVDVTRYAGLVTISPIAPEFEPLFSIALSFPAEVSGVMIRAASDADSLCLHRRCTIYHGWQEIPQTFDLVHRMSQGDSLVIFHTSRSHIETAAGSDGAMPGLAHDHFANDDADMHDFSDRPPHGSDHDMDEEQANERSAASSESSPVIRHGQPPESMQTVKLYMLRQPTIQARVRWGNFANLLTDVARILHVPVAEITALHYIRATPTGDTENEASLIVQFVNDVPDGSTDKLILLDVEVHQHTDPAVYPRSPTVSRMVKRVVLHMARLHLLILGRIQHFCQVHHDRCIVQLDHHIWPHQDLGVREFAHGQYVRLTVPPAPSPDGDTQTAIDILEDAVEEARAYDASEGPLPGVPSVSPEQVNGADPPQQHFQGHPGQDVLDVPIILPPTAAPRRPAVRFDGNTAWMEPLSQLFATQGLHDRTTGTAFLHVLSWYIHHERHTACRQARPVRLENQAIAWVDDLRHAWADALDPSQPLTIHIIHPRPPQWRDYRYACHLLLEQANPGLRSAGILTGLLEGRTRDAISQGAFSVTRPVRFAEVSELLGFAQYCHSQRFVFRSGSQPLSATEDNDLPSGFSAILLVQAPQPSETDEVIRHFEDLSLMQAPVSQAATPPEEGACAGFVFNPEAPAFVLPPTALQAQTEFVQDLHVSWQAQAMAWQDEPPAADVLTWMVDHRMAFPTCTASRPVRLSDDFTHWEPLLRARWADLLDPALRLEFHLVTPAPPLMEPGIAAYVILIQEPRVDWVTNLVTIDDMAMTAIQDGALTRMAITTHEHIFLEHITQACGYGQQCVQRNRPSPIRCRAVIQRVHLQVGMPWPGRSDHADILRQASCQLSLPCEVLMPEPPLFDVPEVTVDPDRIAVRLVCDDEECPMPTFLDFPVAITDTHIRAELYQWGLKHDWTWLPSLQVLLLHTEPIVHHHYFYVDMQKAPCHFSHHDRTAQARTEIAHMRWLCLQGYKRAVMMQPPQRLTDLISVIHFSNPQPESLSHPPRQQTPWPSRLPVADANGPIWPNAQITRQCSVPAPCTWNIGAQFSQIDELFRSASNTLCTSFDGLELPDHVWTALRACEPLERIDRLVIYADGSSLPSQRRRPPLQVEMEGRGDTWAFIVLAEQYVDEHRSKLNVLGWTAQPVLYDPDSSHFIGADVVGSETAEREAMFWCGAWRLALNSKLPTTICTDSRTSGRQASGLDGASSLSQSFRNLRAIYQCLEGSLHPHFQIQHVRGHSQDPWNDFVDVAAKQERRKSFYHRRQSLDMHQWHVSLPHLWTVLCPHTGLPPFTDQGFLITPPALPLESAPVPACQFRTRKVRFHVSLASANVNSLSSGPDGYSGKLQFLRDQMKAFQFNMLGIQESRAPMTCTTTDQVLRLAGGADKGLFGVELWINLMQPFAYVGRRAVCLTKQHVVVTYSDPRILLVKISHELWSAGILVAHAPQSGQSEDARRQWWEDLRHILDQHVTDEKLYVLMDANASPGLPDHIHVGPRGLEPSRSTPFLREFLIDRALVLPCTFPCHEGEQTTWTSPDGTIDSCIDFICLPHGVLAHCTLSRVVPDFDLGHGMFDHFLVAVQLEWHDVQSIAVSHRKQPPCDRLSISFDCLETPLRDYAVPAWTTDIQTHVTHHNAHLHQCLQTSCPAVVRPAKKSFITADIWQLRADKIACRKLNKLIGERYRNELLRATFMGWRQQDPAWHQDHARAFHDYNIALSCWKLHHGLRMHVLAHRLKKALRQARCQALRTQLDQLAPDASATAILHVVKRCVGPTNLKNLKKPTLPMLAKPDGQMCATAEQLLDEWVTFFGAMEGGQRMDRTDLEHHWRTALESFVQPLLDLGPNDVPTLTDLEQAFRRVKSGKAQGLDLIPPEVCNACPTLLARQYFSALLKLLTHGQESLHHKGGLLVPAHKGKGPVALPESYRSLLISSHMGKVLHRTVRQFQADLADRYMCAQQLGGRRHVPVTLGVHEARSFLRFGQGQSRSVGLLLVDLTEAFYRVLRPLAVGCPYTDEQIASIASRLNMPTDTLHELYQHLQEPDALTQAQLPPHLQRTIRALHTNTFFQMHGQTDCCHTTIGSRPGDSFADVVFSYLFARVLKNFQHKIEALGLQEYVPDMDTFDPWNRPPPHAPCMPYLGPVWMDDLCVGVTADTPAALLSKAGTTASVLLETLESFGMTPNLKRGKTELLVSLRGPGVRASKRQLFGPHSDGTLPVVCETGTKHITVTGQYLHLGGQLHHSGDHRHEMRRRLALAHSTFTSHRRSMFQNAAIPLKKRVELFRTLVLSRLMYGSDSWVLVDLKSRQFWQASVIRLYRRLLRASHDAHLSDEAVLNALHLPSPSELLRQTRLRYIGTLHQCSAVVTRGLLNSDTAWCALLCEDLQWMWRQLANSSQLPDPATHFASWRYLWQYHGHYWKGLIKRAVQHAILQRYNNAIVCEAHCHILHRLTTQGRIQVPTCVFDSDDPATPDAFFGCMQCQLKFKSKGGEGAHMFRKHGRLSSLRYLFDQTRCEICMKEYFTYGKLHNHLRHSHACRTALQLSQIQCTPAAGHGSQTNQAQEHRLNGLLPPLPSQGPRMPPPRHREIADFDVDFYGVCAELLQEDLSLPEKASAIRQVVQQSPLSWTRYVHTLKAFGENLTPADAAAFGHSAEDIRNTLDELTQPFSWPFLCQERDRELCATDMTLDVWEWKCDHSLPQEPSGWAPRPSGFGIHRYVLHAFSGRRRPGDFQMFLGSITAQQEGIIVHTLSVDIILDSHWGNVADADVQRFWLHAVRQRWVVGYLAGPPCETWSKAREVSLSPNSALPSDEHAPGPRVIRTVPQPWGLSSLTLRELHQIIIGNQLMLFSVCIMVELHLVEGCGAIEHPALPEKPTSVSVWRTTIMNLLRELPGFELLQFAQGLLGAISAKPTMILALNLPTLGKDICRWRIVDDLPKEVSVGRGTDGKSELNLKNDGAISYEEWIQYLKGGMGDVQPHHADAAARVIDTMEKKKEEAEGVRPASKAVRARAISDQSIQVTVSKPRIGVQMEDVAVTSHVEVPQQEEDVKVSHHHICCSEGCRFQ
eukprot:s450_g28.t1